MIEELGDELLAMGVAIACGASLGVERELRHHRAGLRTLTMICLGSCLFVMAGTTLALYPHWPGEVQIDAGRAAAYVIVGIGFLGAGPIVRRESGAGGLTTAAAIWATAAVGVLVGIGSFGLAIAATVLMLMVLEGLSPLSDRLAGGKRRESLVLHCPEDSLLLARLLHTLRDSGLTREVSTQRRGDGWDVSIAYHATDEAADDLLYRIGRLPGIRGIPTEDEV